MFQPGWVTAPSGSPSSSSKIETKNGTDIIDDELCDPSLIIPLNNSSETPGTGKGEKQPSRNSDSELAFPSRPHVIEPSAHLNTPSEPCRTKDSSLRISDPLTSESLPLASAAMSALTITSEMPSHRFPDTSEYPKLQSATATPLMATIEPFSPLCPPSSLPRQMQPNRGKRRQTPQPRSARPTFTPLNVPITFGETASLTLPTLDKFLVLNSPSPSLIKNPQRFFNDIQNSCGISRQDISSQRDGSLLLKSRTPNMTSTLLNLKTVMGNAVTVLPHKHLNQSQGTIYAPPMLEISEADLTEDLASQGVTRVYRFPSRENGITSPSPRLCLTFDSLRPPSKIIWGFGPRRDTDFTVRLYIKKPTRCFKCNRFGHVSKRCHRSDTLCVHCNGPSHEPPCNSPLLCANCNGPHSSSSTDCIAYKFEQEVLSVQATDFISMREARTLVRSREVRPGVSFSAALRNATTLPLPHVASQGPSRHPPQMHSLTPALSTVEEPNRSTRPKASSTRPSPNTSQRQTNLQNRKDSISQDAESEITLNSPPPQIQGKQALRNSPPVLTPSPPRKRRGASPTNSLTTHLCAVEVHTTPVSKPKIQSFPPPSESVEEKLAALFKTTNLPPRRLRPRSLVKDYPMPPSFPSQMDTSPPPKACTPCTPDLPSPSRNPAHRNSEASPGLLPNRGTPKKNSFPATDQADDPPALQITALLSPRKTRLSRQSDPRLQRGSTSRSVSPPKTGLGLPIPSLVSHQ